MTNLGELNPNRFYCPCGTTSASTPHSCTYRTPAVEAEPDTFWTLDEWRNVFVFGLAALTVGCLLVACAPWR